ncbi:tail assembly chaperone, partial [Aerococcus urinae]
FALIIKDKPEEVTFNYRLMFKMNKKLGTTNQETGGKNNDGVGSFFSRIIAEDDQAIIDLFTLINPKLTENDILSAIETYIGDENVEEKYKSLFANIKEEMIESGFFKKKISDYIKNLEKVVELLKKRDDEDTKLQVGALQEQLGEMKAAIN